VGESIIPTLLFREDAREIGEYFTFSYLTHPLRFIAIARVRTRKCLRQLFGNASSSELTDYGWKRDARGLFSSFFIESFYSVINLRDLCGLWNVFRFRVQYL